MNTPMTFTQIFNQTYKTLKDNFKGVTKVFSLALIVGIGFVLVSMLPEYYLESFFLFLGQQSQGVTILFILLGVLFCLFVLYVLVNIALVAGFYKQLPRITEKKSPISLKETYKKGRPIILEAVKLSIYSGLITAGAMLAAGVPIMFLNVLFPGLQPVLIIFMVIFFLFISLFMLFGQIFLYLEEKKGLAAIRASVILVLKNFKNVFKKGLSLALIIAVTSYILELLQQAASNIVWSMHSGARIGGKELEILKQLNTDIKPVIFDMLIGSVSVIWQTLIIAPFVIIFTYIFYKNILKTGEKAIITEDDKEKKSMVFRTAESLKVLLTLGICAVIVFVSMLLFLISLLGSNIQ